MTLKQFLAITAAAVAIALGPATAQADTINLTTINSTGSGTDVFGNTFYVDWVNQQSTGSGKIDPFLRLGTNADYEQGYNTSIGTPMDDMGGAFTHALLLSSLVTVTIGGNSYYQFLLDINQTGADPLLSLNQIQLFQSTADRADGTAPTTTETPVLGFPTTTTYPAGTTDLVFQMSSGGYSTTSSTGSTINLNFGLNPGSGAGDMMLFLSTSLFNPANGGYVIFYSQFGTPPGANNTNDGFEEWALFGSGSTNPCITQSCGGGGGLSPVPEPASMLLLGTGLIAVAARFRRRKQ